MSDDSGDCVTNNNKAVDTWCTLGIVRCSRNEVWPTHYASSAPYAKNHMAKVTDTNPNLPKTERHRSS